MFLSKLRSDTLQITFRITADTEVGDVSASDITLGAGAAGGQRVSERSSASAGPAGRLVDGTGSKCHVGRWWRCGVVDGTKVVVRR